MFLPTSLTPLEPVVISELMENYLLESPVTAGTTLTVVRDADGNLNVFTIGTGGTVFIFRPDPSSDTGWAQQAIGLTATQIAAELSPNDNLIVFTPLGNTVSFVEADGAGGWKAPQTCAGTLSSPVVHVKARRIGAELLLTLFESVTGDGVSAPFTCKTVAWTGQAMGFDQAINPVGFSPVDSFSVEAVSRNPDNTPTLPPSGPAPGFLTFLTPQVFTKMTNQYGPGPFIQDDGNVNGVKHFTAWKPIAPKGYRPIGDFVRAGADTSVPGDCIATLASVDALSETPLVISVGELFNQAVAEGGDTTQFFDPIWASSGISSVTLFIRAIRGAFYSIRIHKYFSVSRSRRNPRKWVRRPTNLGRAGCCLHPCLLRQ